MQNVEPLQACDLHGMESGAETRTAIRKCQLHVHYTYGHVCVVSWDMNQLTGY